MVSLDFRRLRLLREFEERGTLGAVATALGYSPSAVSQQLSVLEREVGSQLLEKVGRGVRLTDAGHLLVHHAKILLSAAEAASADLAMLGDQVKGTVRASGLQSVARRLLVPAAARVMTRHEHVRLEVSEIELEEALPGLRLGSVDLVVSDEYDGHPRPRPAGLRYASLHEEPVRVVLSPTHPLARGGGPIDLTALREEAWVTSAESTGHHAMVTGTCRSFGGFEPEVRHRANDAEIHLELVRAIGAVALLPALALPRAGTDLAVRDIAGVDLRRRLVIITRAGVTPPASTALIAALADEVRELTTGGGSVTSRAPASRSADAR